MSKQMLYCIGLGLRLSGRMHLNLETNYIVLITDIC